MSTKKSKIKDIIFELDNADISEDEEVNQESSKPHLLQVQTPVLSVAFNQINSFKLLSKQLDNFIKQIAINAGYIDISTRIFGTRLLLYGTLPSGCNPGDNPDTNLDDNSHDQDFKVENSNDSLFFEDVAPSEGSAASEFPNYEKKFNILDSSDCEKEVQKTPQVRQKRSAECFNCDGAHSLKDCTMPKNYAKINQKRNTFRQNKSSHVKRYHLEDENQIVGKDGGFIPGRISADLRDALGLRKNQLPNHIYRMRVLGYPPGWLLHAKITHSGINMFDSTGSKMEDPTVEDGEIETEGSKDKYDIKKIHDFPGFNIPASSRYIDECEVIGYPPMFEVHSKKQMIERLAPRKAEAYKKKKLKLHIKNEKHPDDDTQHAEMDVDDGDNDPEPAFCFVPPLPASDETLPPPPPPLPPSLPEEEEEAPSQPKVHEEERVCDERKCKKEGCSVITLKQKMQLYDEYYNMNYDGQTMMLLPLMKMCEPIRRKKRDDLTQSRRTYTFRYYLYDMEVCKLTFLDAFAITHRRVQTIQQKVKNGCEEFTDGRGKHRNRSRRKSSEGEMTIG